MSIEVDRIGETELFDPSVQETAVDQRVINTALQALDVTAVEAKPIDLITKRDGVLWSCIGVTINPLGGKIYHYKLKDEYDAATRPSKAAECKMAAYKKQLEIFPAIEPSRAVEILFSKELQKIGYYVSSDSTGVYLNLPDLEAIVAGYEKLREGNPDLPPLRSLSSKGIADDLTFCLAYLDYDILLSDGIEFVHDSISHTSRVLEMMISAPTEYVKSKERISTSLEKHLEKLDGSKTESKQILQATTLLGAAIDIIWAAPTMVDLTNVSLEDLDENVLDIWSDHDYQNYWKKIYHTPIDSSLAMGIWTAIN